MAPSQDPVLLYARGLRDALTVALAEYDAPVCRLSLSPSPVPTLDICCDCSSGEGQATVSVLDVTPTENNQNLPCVTEFIARYLVSISRCAAVVGDDGSAPDADELDSDAEKIIRDGWILRYMVQCIFVPEFEIDYQDWEIESWSPQNVQGGCASSGIVVGVRWNCSPGC